jgi:hypothetical protein
MSSLGFINEHWFWTVVLVFICLCILFVWKEWRGTLSKLFLLNSLIAIIGLTALALMVLRPTWEKAVEGSAILITEGYEQSQLDSLKNGYKTSQYINYLPGISLTQRLDSIKEVILIGDGLKPYDFWQLENKEVTYLKGDKPKGITRVTYLKDNFIGETFKVTGGYNSIASAHKLVLQNSGGLVLDSVVIDKKGLSSFNLKTNLKTSGKFVFTIIEKDSLGKVLASEPLPLIVKNKKPLRVLIINQFPSFETKYLKNFLSEEGHEIVVRSQITKNKFKFEYLNTGESPVYRLTSGNLNNFDLLILDGPSLFSLSQKAKQVVQEEVRINGLGVFIQPSDQVFRRSSDFIDFQTKADITNTIQISNLPNVIVEKYPYQFKEKGLKSVVLGNYGIGISNGKGRMATSILNNTYQLILQGKNSAYKQIWTRIIEGVAKRKVLSKKIGTKQVFLFKDEPFLFNYRSKVKPSQFKNRKESPIPMIKDVVINDMWHGTIYPDKLGWSSITSIKDSLLNLDYFVMNEHSWKSVQRTKTQEENNRHFTGEKTNDSITMIPVELERIWLLTLVILCFGYLWLYPKLIN